MRGRTSAQVDRIRTHRFRHRHSWAMVGLLEAARANEAGVDDLHLPLPSWEAEQAAEAIDPGQVGIAVMLGLTALVGLGLALMVAIVHST